MFGMPNIADLKALIYAQRVLLGHLVRRIKAVEPEAAVELDAALKDVDARLRKIGFK